MHVCVYVCVCVRERERERERERGRERERENPNTRKPLLFIHTVKLRAAAIAFPTGDWKLTTQPGHRPSFNKTE